MTDVNLKIHNRFDINVEHVDGTVDKYTHYNIVLNNLYNTQHFTTGLMHSTKWTSQIVFGTGVGETSADRTTLFEPLASKSTTLVYSKSDYKKGTGEAQFSITIEPQEHVGKKLTEVGFGSTSSAFTHSLIKDSFGNPISIHKTATDKITIYATVFAEINTSNDVGVMNFKNTPLIEQAMGSWSNNSNWVRYSIKCAVIDPICTDWLSHDARKESGRYHSDSSSRSGYGVKTTLELGINDFNNLDIRSLAFGYGTSFNSYMVPIRGEKFSGVNYVNQQIASGDGTTTKFKVPVQYRGVKDCSVKVNNSNIEVTKHKTYGNNRLVGIDSSYYHSTYFKISDTKFARVTYDYLSSTYGYTYKLIIYEIENENKINVTHEINLGTHKIANNNYIEIKIFPEFNLLAIKQEYSYRMYEVDFETGNVTFLQLISLKNANYAPNTVQALYHISNTNYFAVQMSYSSTSYAKELYEFNKESKTFTKVKDLTYIPSLFMGPTTPYGILKGDYYCDDGKLYKFNVESLEFESVKTLPFSTSNSIIISPFTVATMKSYPGDSSSQQLTITKYDSDWQSLETIVFQDKFPMQNSGLSCIYLKDNVFLIGSHIPHIVTFYPDTNEILYRCHKSGMTDDTTPDYNCYEIGFKYKPIVEFAEYDNFIFQMGRYLFFTEQEVAAIEFTNPPAEGDDVTIDFTLDYIPKNDSLIATLSHTIKWG